MNLHHPLPTGFPAQRGNALLHLTLPLFEMILQIQAGQVQPTMQLRTTVSTWLRTLEQGATPVGYSLVHIRLAQFALVAHVDELVRTSDFPFRNEWEGNPLQLEFFQTERAGVEFFDKLATLMTDPQSNADVLELYYLCLVCDYKGKYRIYLEHELQKVIEGVAECLKTVGRLRSSALSLRGFPTDVPARPVVQIEPGWPRWLKRNLILALSLTVMLYVVFQSILFLLIKQALGLR